MPDSRVSDQERASRIPEDVPQSGAAPDANTGLRPGDDVTLELDAGLIAWFMESGPCVGIESPCSGLWQRRLRPDTRSRLWFKQNEDKYQTAINAALREHMERQRSTT